MIKVIDLFAGAGGMSLGFQSPEFCGGFETILALDNDVAAIKTHKLNFAGIGITENIESWLDRGDVPQADVVIGGPPCQGFSLLNKNRVGDQRRELWEPYLDVVKLSKARVFVMENVAELFRSLELDKIRKRADDFGFDTDAQILNSADYGTPQTRKRTIVLGWSRKKLPSGIRFPDKTNYSPELAEKLQKTAWRTVYDAIHDLPPMPNRTEIAGAQPLDLHFGRTPTALSIKRYKKVPEGGNRFDLQRKAPHLTPACWIKKTSGGTDLFGRLWWDRPSVTIRTEFFKPEKGRYLHPSQHRPITHREAARLMGFPDSFKFFGSKVEIARQIGNAVPPHLAGAIARNVLFALNGASLKVVEKIESAFAAE